MKHVTAIGALLVCVSVSASEVDLAGMHVTEGAGGVRQLASGLIEINGPRFRATERAVFSNRAVIPFAYLGMADGATPLASGELRVQFGAKMLAVNPCNLLYVMWRLYPAENLVVSIKRHPGTTSGECGANGYTNIVPDQIPDAAASAAVPIPSELSARGGQRRTLVSYYNPANRILSVAIDGQPVWRGRLPAPLVSGLFGPSGVRSDNGRFRFQMYSYKTRGR